MNEQKLTRETRRDGERYREREKGEKIEGSKLGLVSNNMPFNRHRTNIM